MTDEIGERFAEAIAKKDSAGLTELLDPEIDFRALTPNRFWESNSAATVVDDVVFGTWFDSNDHIDSLEHVQVGSVVDREKVEYRFHITNPDGAFLVEQQAYFRVSDGRIKWLRILCSGFCRVDS
jgi:hypothetical protein